ncbi:MAG: NADH:flavin oxidoreductase [Thermotogae bacterium]|nr:NADH:flavin oxidoreductase [Thermotogota bacterium]
MKRFHYRDIEDLKRECEALEIEIPIGSSVEILKTPVRIKSREIANRLAIHPMEGSDAEIDGKPGPLTIRRYERYARGGAALIWFEATAVTETGRASEKQLFLNDQTKEAFQELVNKIKEEGFKEHGFVPYLILQLTHSGRFGKCKKILYHAAMLDKASHVDSEAPIMSDEELDWLKGEYLKAAKLAKEAGFDAVDVKACHRYLISEALSAHTREGKYGGSYENRTRMLKDIISLIKDYVDIDIAVRLNVYDAIPYPYGWGCDENGGLLEEEPRRLVRELEALGVSTINVTASTPYIYPHINRPYDESKDYHPPEHPLKGVSRLLKLAKLVSEETKNVLVVGTGYSWLREFAPYVAAAMIENGWSHLVGFGRQAFAYPDFAGDILERGRLDREKLCITCNKCAELKAATMNCGCVVRDAQVYGPIYNELLRRRKRA